jgi:hypothetical protein
VHLTNSLALTPLTQKPSTDTGSVQSNLSKPILIRESKSLRSVTQHKMQVNASFMIWLLYAWEKPLEQF